MGQDGGDAFVGHAAIHQAQLKELAGEVLGLGGGAHRERAERLEAERLKEEECGEERDDRVNRWLGLGAQTRVRQSSALEAFSFFSP